MTAEFRKLSFSFDTATLASEAFNENNEEIDGPPYRSVEARPVVDGLPLLPTGYLFDTLAVLSYGRKTCATDLFTCSCGVAGCAGIHEEVEIVRTVRDVSWTFPEDPFRTRLEPRLFPAGEFLTVRFARGQYDAALRALERELEVMGADGGLPVVIPPDSSPDLSLSVRTQIQNAKKFAAQYLKRLAHRKAIFGLLYDQRVVVQFADGVRRYLAATVAAELQAEHISVETDEDSSEVLEKVVLPELLRNPHAIGEVLRTLPWDFVRSALWRFAGDTDVADDTVLAAQWASAVFTLAAYA